MHAFTLITALFAAFSVTHGEPEKVQIKDFTIRKDTSGGKTEIQDIVQSGSFKLVGPNGKEIQCNDEINCGDTNYSTGILKGDKEEFALVVYRQPEGGDNGATGQVDIPTVCTAGGNGPDDFVCTATKDVTIELS